MNRVFSALRVIVALLICAFIALSPSKLLGELDRNYYREFLSPASDDTGCGIITVWHVVGFKTYQGSVSSFIEDVAAVYEKNNNGVYIEVEGMSIEALAEKKARGERPDIWSIPMQYLDEADFLSLSGGFSSPEILEGLSLFADKGGIKAVPYLLSGYYLIGNTLLLADLGLTFPAGEDFFSEGLKSSLNEATNSNGTSRYGALNAPVIHAALLNISATLASDGDFKAGQVPYMIADARALGDLNRKKDGFTMDSLALGGYTEQVQYLGLDKKLEDEKQAHCEAFINELLGEKTQLKLTSLAAIPAIKLDEAPSYTAPEAAALYEAYSKPQAPNPNKYCMEYDELYSKAKASLEGDASAKSDFLKRYGELILFSI